MSVRVQCLQFLHHPSHIWQMKDKENYKDKGKDKENDQDKYNGKDQDKDKDHHFRVSNTFLSLEILRPKSA